MSTADRIQAALQRLQADLGARAPFLDTIVGESWTRFEMTLPDGLALHVYDEDLDVIVVIHNDVTTRMRLSDVSTELLTGVLHAILAAHSDHDSGTE